MEETLVTPTQCAGKYISYTRSPVKGYFNTLRQQHQPVQSSLHGQNLLQRGSRT